MTKAAPSNKPLQRSPSAPAAERQGVRRTLPSLVRHHLARQFLQLSLPQRQVWFEAARQIRRSELCRRSSP
jgi:hypothetical protein